MITSTTIPPDTPLRIPKGADWAGVQIPIYDSAGVLRSSLVGCTAVGAIRPRPGDPTSLYVWSTSPSAGQGALTFSGGYLVVGVLGAHSSLFGFTVACWRVDLTDPSAPVGQRTIIAGHGPLIVEP